MSDEIKCPRCGSSQIHADKKGFSSGKAIAGTLLGGAVVGGIAGIIGSNKIKLTCLKCGHTFYPEDKEKEKRQELENKIAQENFKKNGGSAILTLVVLVSIFLILALLLTKSCS